MYVVRQCQVISFEAIQKRGTISVQFFYMTQRSVFYVYCTAHSCWCYM